MPTALPRRVHRRRMIVVVAAALVIAACGTDRDPTTPPPEPSPAAGTDSPILTIQGSTFASVTVPAGSEVTVDNRDAVPHTVTSDTFDVSVGGNSQATFVVPEAAGNYDIMCRIHPSMTATIVVE